MIPLRDGGQTGVRLEFEPLQQVAQEITQHFAKNDLMLVLCLQSPRIAFVFKMYRNHHLLFCRQKQTLRSNFRIFPLKFTYCLESKGENPSLLELQLSSRSVFGSENPILKGSEKSSFSCLLTFFALIVIMSVCQLKVRYW